MDGHDAYDSAEASHRALRGIQRELDRHPAVETVRGFPAGEYTQVVAELSTLRLETAASGPTLTVRWFAGDSPDADPSFRFTTATAAVILAGTTNRTHTSTAGVISRNVPALNYSYEPHTFTAENPTRLVWEVMAHLTTKLE